VSNECRLRAYEFVYSTELLNITIKTVNILSLPMSRRGVHVYINYGGLIWRNLFKALIIIYNDDATFLTRMYLFIIPLFRPEYISSTTMSTDIKFSTANFKAKHSCKVLTLMEVFSAFFMYFLKMLGLKDLVTPVSVQGVKTPPTENAQN
jgi:hypothetical protein